MHRLRHVEGEVLQARARRLRDQLVAEELVEAGHAELDGRVRRPVGAEVDADIGLRGELRVVAAHALRRDGEVADLRRAVAGRHAAAELPGVVRPIEQPASGAVLRKSRWIGVYAGTAVPPGKLKIVFTAAMVVYSTPAAT